MIEDLPQTVAVDQDRAIAIQGSGALAGSTTAEIPGQAASQVSGQVSGPVSGQVSEGVAGAAIAPLAAHVIITGRVQGVCYRLATQQEAQRLALAGWVRNLPSGQVEAVFEGDRDALEDMVLWCHQGPSQARVTQVALHWHVAQGYDSFTIRP